MRVLFVLRQENSKFEDFGTNLVLRLRCGAVMDLLVMDGNDVSASVDAMRKFYDSDATRPLSVRKRYLRLLREAIMAHEGDIARALYDDLHKSLEEAYITETAVVLSEIRCQLRHMKRWARTVRVHAPLGLYPSSGVMVREPKGVVLVMSPWNYPFQLALDPLVGAVAAGNCVALRPSGTSAATRRVIGDIISEVFPEEYVTVFDGDHCQADNLLGCRFDHIFFTGGTGFGRTVMERAAANLTPVTLELGGKSPCVVDAAADIRLAARRIMWGKLMNAGQTCIAPDYLLVHRSVKDELVAEMKRCVAEFYGDDLRRCDYYPRIVSDRAFERLRGYVDSAEHILWGGEYDAASRFMAPVLIDEPSPQSPVMREEIFGPVLPVLAFDSMQEVVSFINGRDKPLALYYFGRRHDGMELLSRVTSGGACINETIVHVANPALPFGGVGRSGVGRYHGRYSFDTFSHLRGVAVSPSHADMPLRYPPYGRHFRLLKKMM